MTPNKKEHAILSYIYHFRCLTSGQIYDLVYKEENLNKRTCQNAISHLVSSNFVDKIGFFNDSSYYTIRSEGVW